MASTFNAISDALRYSAQTFRPFRSNLSETGESTSVVDEGGFAPQLKRTEQACDLIAEAIVAAGCEPGKGVSITLSPAASSFYENGKYRLARSGQGDKSSNDMLKCFTRWVDKCPIVSLEDGHDENAKYNRMLEIDRALGQAAVFGT